MVCTVKSLTFGPGAKVHASMGSLWQSQLVGHILRHLHSRSLLGFWVCSSKRKPKVPPASNHWTVDLDPTQGSQYHCFARRWAFLRAALAGSKMQQDLRTSQGSCRQAVKNRKQEANLAGTWFGGAAPKQLRTALASRTQVLIQGFSCRTFLRRWSSFTA